MEIQTNFDSNSPANVRGEFIDISKAFDKVRHTGLLFKLKSYSVQGELLSLLERYLIIREQRVALNSQISHWRKINSGMPKRSVLGPHLFLIYIYIYIYTYIYIYINLM